LSFPLGWLGVVEVVVVDVLVETVGAGVLCFAFPFALPWCLEAVAVVGDAAAQGPAVSPCFR
jgi:hypothetical protein